MTIESLIAYAHRIRQLRQTNPTNLEQALAPTFQKLLDNLLPSICGETVVVLPEYARPGIGRPDIALTRRGQLPRAFVELKAPTKPANPAQYRDLHDRKQFERFKSLPVWAISNFSSLRVYKRDELVASVEIVPDIALEADTSDAKADRLLRAVDTASLVSALTPLAFADPPPANDAKQLAGNMAPTV